MGIMQRGARTFARLMKVADPREVVYRRGASSFNITAGVPADQKHSVPEEHGFLLEVKYQDWLIETADLVLRGEAIEPRSGDQIIETLNDVEIAYEVLPLGNEPASQWADTSGIMTLVHTKRIRRTS